MIKSSKKITKMYGKKTEENMSQIINKICKKRVRCAVVMTRSWITAKINPKFFLFTMIQNQIRCVIKHVKRKIMKRVVKYVCTNYKIKKMNKSKLF